MQTVHFVILEFLELILKHLETSTWQMLFSFDALELNPCCLVDIQSAWLIFTYDLGPNVRSLSMFFLPNVPNGHFTYSVALCPS